MHHGNEDTFREMLRLNRSVQAQFTEARFLFSPLPLSLLCLLFSTLPLSPLLSSLLVSSCLVASICYRFFTNEGGKSPEELQALRTVCAARTRLALRVCRRRGGAGFKAV